MKKFFLFTVFLILTLKFFPLTIEGNFSLSNKKNPQAISLYCVTSIWAFTPGEGSFPLVRTDVGKDGRFKLECKEVLKEAMLYFLVMEEGSSGFSMGMVMEKYIPLWMDKDSKMTLPEIRLQSSRQPAFDTSNTDKTNTELQGISAKLFELYVSGMQDTAARFTPQQLVSKKKYANEEARKLLIKNLSLPASVLVYERFEMGEEVQFNKEFYANELERLSEMMPGHIYVSELKELIESESKTLSEMRVAYEVEKKSDSGNLYLKIFVALLLIAGASFFLYRSIRKKRK